MQYIILIFDDLIKLTTLNKKNKRWHLYLKYPLLSSDSARVFILAISTSSYPRNPSKMKRLKVSPKHLSWFGSRVTIFTGIFNLDLVAGERRRNPYSSEYSTMYSSSGQTLTEKRIFFLEPKKKCKNFSKLRNSKTNPIEIFEISGIRVPQISSLPPLPLPFLLFYLIPLHFFSTVTKVFRCDPFGLFIVNSEPEVCSCILWKCFILINY